MRHALRLHRPRQGALTWMMTLSVSTAPEALFHRERECVHASPEVHLHLFVEAIGQPPPKARHESCAPLPTRV